MRQIKKKTKQSNPSLCVDGSIGKQRKLSKAEDQHLKKINNTQTRKLSEVRTGKCHKIKQLKYKQEIERAKKEFEE